MATKTAKATPVTKVTRSEIPTVTAPTEPKLLACRDFILAEPKRVTNEYLEITLDGGAVFGGGKIYLHQRVVNTAVRLRIAIWETTEDSSEE